MSEEKTMRKTLQQIRFLIALAALFVSSLAGAGTMRTSITTLPDRLSPQRTRAGK